MTGSFSRSSILTYFFLLFLLSKQAEGHVTSNSFLLYERKGYFSSSSVKRIAMKELNRAKKSMTKLQFQVKEIEVRSALESIRNTANSSSQVKQFVQDIVRKVKIVGGRPAGEYENPFQVSLVDAQASDNFAGHFCSGSVLSARYIVTAAHCVARISTSRINIVYRTRILDGSGFRTSIKSVHRHRKYNQRTLEYDVAVIDVGKDVLWYPVDLGQTEPTPGEMLLVTGWGRTQLSEGKSRELLALDTPVVSKTLCNGPSSYNGRIKDTMFCAGYMAGGKGHCRGDSGGPITGGLGKGVLYGIVSWSFKRPDCASSNFPGVYARVSHPEIRSFITSFAPAPVYPTRNPGRLYTVEGYGTFTDVYILVKGRKQEIWGTRKYANVKATADAYCRGKGFIKALFWESNACGEDESAFARYNPGRRIWESRGSGSANNRGGYCLYPLMTSIRCSPLRQWPSAKVTLKMGGATNSRGIGRLLCDDGPSCSITGNTPFGKSCSINCPIGSTVTLRCSSNDPQRPVSSARFTKNASGSRTVVTTELPIEGWCNFRTFIKPDCLRGEPCPIDPQPDPCQRGELCAVHPRR